MARSNRADGLTKKANGLYERMTHQGMATIQRQPRNPMIPNARMVWVLTFEDDSVAREATTLYGAVLIMVGCLKSRAPKTHMVRNLMSGKMVEERIDTPYTCSVASETYWAS